MARIMAGKCIVAMILLFALEGCAMSMQNSDTKVLTGTIRIVGNEPFAKVMLTLGSDPDMATIGQEYLIVGPLREALRRNYQWKRVTLEGAFCSSPDPVYKNCFKPVRIVNVVGR